MTGPYNKKSQGLLRRLSFLRYFLFNYLSSFKYSDLAHIDLLQNPADSLMAATKDEINIEITRNILNTSFLTFSKSDVIYSITV